MLIKLAAAAADAGEDTHEFAGDEPHVDECGVDAPEPPLVNLLIATAGAAATLPLLFDDVRVDNNCSMFVMSPKIHAESAPSEATLFVVVVVVVVSPLMSWPPTPPLPLALKRPLRARASLRPASPPLPADWYWPAEPNLLRVVAGLAPDRLDGLTTTTPAFPAENFRVPPAPTTTALVAPAEIEPARVALLALAVRARLRCCCCGIAGEMVVLLLLCWGCCS